MERDYTIVGKILYRKAIADYIVGSIKEMTSIEYSIYLYILLITISVLHPLDKALVLVYAIAFAIKFHRTSPAVIAVAIAYTLVYLVVGVFYAIIVVTVYTLLLSIFSRSKTVFLATLLASIIACYTAVNDVASINDYMNALREWIKEGSSWWIPVHLVATSIAFENTLIHLPYIRGSRVSTYLIKSPGAMPVVQFMIFLSTAAVYLALGAEALANRLAELAYYSLVVGVVFEVYSTFKEQH